MNTRKAIFDSFVEKLEQNPLEGLSVAKQRMLADMLTDVAYTMFKEQQSGMAETYQANVLELEQHRKMFKDQVEFLEKNTKVMLDSFKRQGFIKYDKDPKTKKTIMVARTSMVTDMVQFLNQLNQMVMDFYQNVYKIDSSEDAYKAGIQQTSLFQ